LNQMQGIYLPLMLPPIPDPNEPVQKKGWFHLLMVLAIICLLAFLFWPIGVYLVNFGMQESP
jgi:hypothetical protein